MNRYREQANLLRLMAHPVRLEILDLLRRDEACVCHLSAVLGKSQPYVSQQLAILRNAGLIVDEKEGSNVFYRLADEGVLRQIEATLGPAAVSGPAGAASAYRRVDGCPCPKCN